MPSGSQLNTDANSSLVDRRTGDYYAENESRIEARFAEYPAKPGQVRAISPALVSGIGRKMSDVEATEANFASRYVIMSGHCGTGCQIYAVVNAAKAQEENKLVASLGADWRRDSRLVIINPPAELVDFGSKEVPRRLQPQCYVWTADEAFSEVICQF